MLLARASPLSMRLAVPHTRWASSAATAPRTLAVAGGGIAGLTTALLLARALPSHRILLLERAARSGGWVQSERRALEGGGTALLESGPRSIRPSGAPGLAMLELLGSLSLLPTLLLVPKTAPSAQNRFVWHTSRLVRLPSSLLALPRALRERPLRALLPALWREWRTPSRHARPRSESPAEQARQRARSAAADESVAGFLARRMGAPGRRLVDDLVSAVLHGIYAGSARDLSVRAVMPSLWDMEARGGGLLRSLLPARFNRARRDETAAERRAREEAEHELRELETSVGSEVVQRMKGISVYSLPDGIEAITRAIEAELRALPNVSVLLDAGVQRASVREDGAVQLDTPSGTHIASRLVSAMPGAALDAALESALPWLAHNPSADVGVVNIALPAPLVAQHVRGRVLPVQGFGYLIPSGTPNPAGVLGVVFDSDSLPTQDAAGPTKLTVMIGGPHWKGRAALPDEHELRRIALDALHEHLGIARALLEAPEAVIVARVHRACIPHYAVGHLSRMRQLHEALTRPPWRGRLALVGASWTGVSLNDCVLGARRTAQRIIDEERGGAGDHCTTGLERFASSDDAPEREALGQEDGAVGGGILGNAA